ncbi:MAG: hypothetical protein ABL931_05810, partial [Usitatibacteraceae bacterium]
MIIAGGAIERRTFLTSVALGGVVALNSPYSALSALPAPHNEDWKWLAGNWGVQHSRLRDRLANSTQWDEFQGRSAAWLTMGGLGTVDDNILDLPAGEYRCAGLRAYDPVSGKWRIWWIDGRNPSRIDPPVLGGFDGQTGT